VALNVKLVLVMMVVPLVLITLTEMLPQNVHVLQVIMIMEIKNVLNVQKNVLLVKLMILVMNVVVLEKINHIVIVQKDIMIPMELV